MHTKKIQIDSTVVVESITLRPKTYIFTEPEAIACTPVRPAISKYTGSPSTTRSFGSEEHVFVCLSVPAQAGERQQTVMARAASAALVNCYYLYFDSVTISMQVSIQYLPLSV